VLDPSADAPCAPFAHQFVCGNFNDEATVYEFGRNLDVVTVEIEHVNVEALARLKKAGVQVYPDPEILKMIQDKGAQKQFYRLNSLPTSAFFMAENTDELKARSGLKPGVQKLRKGGYDGKGVQVIKSAEDYTNLMEGPSVFEELVDIHKELAVIVARSENGEIKAFPAVEMVFDPKANLVDFLLSPADISKEAMQQAEDLAIKLVKCLDFVGLMAVEMFQDKSGTILINEIAPRPHNSGHQTIEGNITSQYAQHIRAILGMPLGDTAIIRPAVMLNLLGEAGFSGKVFYEGMEKVLAKSGVYVHLYGKTETRPFRKMGHITVTGKTSDEVVAKAMSIRNMTRVISKD
jgi:5-(carboxyamino)imidazole ribonucleotide synthase